MFNFLLPQCQFVYLRVFLTNNLFSVVYCRVFLSLSCIVVYYPINYRVCSFVYWNTRYTKISCIKSETIFCVCTIEVILELAIGPNSTQLQYFKPKRPKTNWSLSQIWAAAHGLEHPCCTVYSILQCCPLAPE